MTTQGTIAGTLRLRTGEVDLGRQRLITPTAVVALTTRETELLAYLADRAGEAVAREALLVDVWHYRATNPTRAVDLAVKRLRSKIEPDPSEPVHILSVHGVGYRFVPASGPTVAVAAQGVLAHDLPPERVGTNLVSERTTFVGRASELGRLRELAEGGARLITVTGPAGTGKTRLARRFAGDDTLLGPAPGGAWFCDLSEVRTLEGIVGAVVSSLGLLADTEPTPDQVGRALGERSSAAGRMLVVLDNFEQLVEFATDTVGRWLDLAPDVLFLVTSRERLHVRGERILELAPMAAADGLLLLLDRANAVRRGLDLSDADRQVLQDVVVELDGIPLAIELAASRLGTLSPVQLRKRLASRFRLLGDPRSDRPRRHATLEAALDWSWDLTSQHERMALASLSVFEGGFSLEAAEEVLDDPDDPDLPWPADLVQSLRDKSLLAVEDQPGGDMRYRLLESVREYAAKRLADDGRFASEARVRGAHATYYIREGEDLVARLHGASAADRMSDLVRERANLVAVARNAPKPEQRLRAVLCLYPVLLARGPMGLLEELLASAIELGRADPTIERRLVGRLLVDRGFHWYGRGRLTEAEVDFADAARVAPQHLDVYGRAHMGLGRTLCDLGRLDEAANSLRESIELFSRLGDRSGEGRARSIFAEVLAQQECVDEAASEYDRALRVLRRVGDRWSEGILFANLAAFLLERRRDAEGAERHATEALEILSELGDHRMAILLLDGFAIALIRMARPEEGLERIEQALRIARQMGDRPRVGAALSIRGWAEFELGNLDRAEEALAEALAILREVGDRSQCAITLRRQSALFQERERWVEAEHALVEASADIAIAGSKIEQAVTRLQFAQLRFEQGDLQETLAQLDATHAEGADRWPWLEQQAAMLRAVALARVGHLDAAREAIAVLAGASLDPREARLAEVTELALGAFAGDAAAIEQVRRLLPPSGFAETRLVLRAVATASLGAGRRPR
ncbi:MAG: winged helix-turn-helix domain-containing protein [Myxococcota bacterium]